MYKSTIERSLLQKCYGKTDNIGIGDQNPRSAESIDSRDSGDSWCHEHGMTDLPTSSIVTVREISQELYDPLSEVYSVCENSPLAEFVVGSDVKQNSISVY